MLLDDEVLAVLTAVVVVACAVAASTTPLLRRGEPFLALGLLGPGGKIGDYPRMLVAGEPVRLHVFVANHLGKVALLKVEAKIGSRGNIPTNSNPLNTTPIWEYEIVLDHGQNATIPVQLTVDVEGLNLALVFELWMYNTSSGTWVYTGRWNHLYVNVTRVRVP